VDPERGAPDGKRAREPAPGAAIERGAATPVEASAGRSWAPLLAFLGMVVWVRVFTTWFAQDDFHWMLRAARGAPVSLTTPRLLSMSLYFRAWHALFGAHPSAFHAFNLALHLAGGLLFYRLLARRLSAGTAAAAAAVFITSPALFDALHWVSAIAELMCGACLALTLWLLLGGEAGPGRRWGAVVTYALALASKEIAVGAAPVMILLHARGGGRAGAVRALTCMALAALCALSAAGAWQTGVGEPYALRPLAALKNLPAFTAASGLAGTAYASASDLDWSRRVWVQVAGWALLGAWIAALIARRSRPAWLGFLWFVGLLSPVVMLERQLYLYYLYCALPGLVASAAFLVAGGGARRPGWVPWATGALIVAQAAAIEARSTARLEAAPLPADFVLRRAVIARNAIDDLARRPEALRPRVVLLGQQPVDAAWKGASTTQTTDYRRDPWWDENVRGALSNGEALQLMLPAVREAVFKPWLEPKDTSSTIAAYGIDGHLTASDYASFIGVPNLGAPATLAQHVERAGAFIQRRLFTEALRELLAARALAPDHPDVLVNLGALQVHMGDSTAGLQSLTHAVEVTPGDVDARYNLGLLQWRLGRRSQARATWQPLLAEAPESDLAKAVRDLLAGRAR
jgi:tetratricopeptide (TPR) repeat protein